MRTESLKIKKTVIPRNFLSQILDSISENSTYSLTINTPFPEDANIIAIYTENNNITVIVESASFEKVGDGEEIPEYMFTLTRTEKPHVKQT